MPEHSEATFAESKVDLSYSRDYVRELVGQVNALQRALYDVLADYDRAGWVHAETLRRAHEALRESS